MKGTLALFMYLAVHYAGLSTGSDALGLAGVTSGQGDGQQVFLNLRERWITGVSDHSTGSGPLSNRSSGCTSRTLLKVHQKSKSLLVYIVSENHD
jgi:hypothetical protein